MSKRDEAGFTLVELLVALAVLGTVGAAVVQAERLALDATRRSAARAKALVAAASLLAERMAGARRDGEGRLAGGLGVSIASRPRPDLIRSGAPYRPIEHLVQVEPRGAGPVRLAGIGWVALAPR